MASLIQKAGRKHRTALTMLYETHKRRVFSLCHALLRNYQSASDVTISVMRSALQMVIDQKLSTEEDFAIFTIKQAVDYCRKEILKQDSKAFSTSPKQDYHIQYLQTERIGKYAGPLENYLNHLPVFQRFVFALRYIGDLSVSDVSTCLDIKSETIQLILEAEPDNLSRIYRAVKSAGGQCTPPSSELLKTAFKNRTNTETVPQTLDQQILSFIDFVCVPAEQTRRRKSKHLLLAVCCTVLLTVLLLIVISTLGNTSGSETASAATSTTEIAETKVSPTEAEITEPFQIREPQDVEEPITEISKNTDTVTYTAQIEILNYGTITVALDAEAAPITVENFVALAESGFYDGLTFHRIIEDFMMQGGDPNGDGTGGSENTIVGEFAVNGYNNDLSHTRGAISMARANDYNSASSQFFIVHEDSTFLDGQYAVFGYVTDGLDIVDKICESAEPTDSNGSIDPDAQPVIKSITIQTQE